MKNLLLLICLCSPFMGAYAQRTLHLKTGQITDKIESTVPYRDIEKTDDGYLVTYTFEKAVIQDDPLFQGTVFWKVEGFGLNDIPGEAEYLFRNDLFVVPANTNPVVEVVDRSFTDFQYELTPARQPIFNNDDIGYNKETVKPIVPFEDFQPSTLAFLSGTSSYRGQGLCYATVRPIQYNYKEKTVRAYSSITYKVTFEQSVEDVGMGGTPNIRITDNFLRNVAIGGESVITMQSNLSSSSAQYDVQNYLIISTPELEEAVNRFAEWKRTLGFNVVIDLRNNWDAISVKQAVNSSDALDYLLIIGDHDDVPAETIYNYPIHVTDYYYGDTNNDYYQDVKTGRFPVSNLTEANTVVDKIISYEKNPPINGSFYNKGVNCAFFQDGNMNYTTGVLTGNDGYEDQRFVKTSEEIRDYVIAQGKNVQRIYYAYEGVTPTHWNNGSYASGDEIPLELQDSAFDWRGNASKIIQAINSGCFYILHRDHGMVRGWRDPWFETSQLNFLTNGNLLPVVFSINCESGKFDEDCFAKAFLKKENGGCVAIYAPTQDSYSGYNDAMVNGMFDAIWPDPGLRITFPGMSSGSQSPTPTYTLGQILAQGLQRMEDTYGANTPSSCRYAREIYHCLGDPSMQIYTNQPTAFENVNVLYNSNGISVSLASGETARITFYDKNSGNIASYLGNNANFATANPYDVTVCVSAHNKIPYIKEGTIYIQNETISGNQNYDAGQILVGSDVTTARPSGNAVFSNGNVIMKADKVVLDKGTTVGLGTTLKINNQ